jgi:hypothetical protein
MIVSRWLRHAAAVGALAACPVAAHAQLHSDAAMTGWSSQVIVNPYGCSSASGATSPTGGNPGSFWNFNQYDCGTLVFTAHLSTFSWNPYSQGAITGNLTMGYDISTSTGGQVAFENVIRQGGKWFVSDYHLATYGLGWESVLSTPTAWCEVFLGFGPPNGYTCGGGQPDFTSSGGQIDFGVVSANSGSYSRSGGIDNFTVDFQHDPGQTVAPEPASIALVATGVLGLGLVTRRRRKA